MKKFSILLTIFSIAIITSELSAQDYQISFSGTGESTLIDSVMVENLTSRAMLTIKGDDILLLSPSVGIHQFADVYNSEMRIYPNPMLEKATIEISTPIKGNANLTIYELTGKPICQLNCFFENSNQEFSITGLKKGLYLISVTGETYHYSGKLLCSGNGNGNLSLKEVNATTTEALKKKTKKTTNDNQNTVGMLYKPGERLKLIAVSGDFRTVNTLIPTQNETIAFNFVPCTDGDNNTYPIVEIGEQIWMAENLKYLPSVVGPTEISTTIPYYYVYGYDGTVVADAKATGVWNDFGVLYNWPAAHDAACPTGWHLPSNADWKQLTDYLGGVVVAGGKLKETGITYWMGPNGGATNETGFTARGSGSLSYGFGGIRGNTFWWTISEYNATIAWLRNLNFGGSFVNLGYESKELGYSVRCIKD